MAQTISFGAYTIHIDGDKLTILNHDGQVIASADLSKDATAKIALPDGTVLDTGKLADALASDHIADFATAAGGGGGGSGGGSGMFFADHDHRTLGGFGELDVLKPSAPATPAPQPDQNQDPISSAHQDTAAVTPADPTTPTTPEQPPVNHAPSTTDLNASTAEDSTITSHVGGTDPDGDTLGYQIVTGPSHGTLTFNSDGSYTYTPNTNYNGGDSFTYKANDGSLDSNTSTVHLTVTPVNDAPVVTDETLTTKEDTVLHGSVTGSDVDGDHLTFSLVDAPQHGTVSFNADGTFTYTPNGDYNGSDSFTYKANDGTVDSQPATVSLNVTPVNDAPVVADETLTTTEDIAIHGSVTGSDVDGDHLTFSLVDAPQHGTVTFNSDGTFTYTPNGDYNGADSFTYKANDGRVDSQPATVSLNVTPVNDAPVVADETLTTKEDTAIHGSVTGSDVDGDHLTFSLVDAPQHGTVTFNSDGTFTYTPNGDYNGADRFTYKANDGSVDSQPATVSLNVTPVNDAPVVADETLTTKEDTAIHGSVTGSDVDGDHLTFSLVDAPQHGTVSFNADGTFTYTPSGDYNGADSFTYKANDGTLDSQPATVSLNVTPVNDAPVAMSGEVTTAEDTQLHGQVTATDVDGDHLGYALVDGPQHGTITFNADGSYVYTPGKDYNGSDSFTFKANDGSLDSNVGTVNLNVTPVNDAPVAISGQVTTAEDTQVHGQVTATDVDGDHLGYTLVSGPQHGTITFNADGSYVYTPGKDYNGSDSFTFKANDGSLDSNVGTVNLNVTPVNDAPVAISGQVTTAEDTQVHGQVTATDVDGDHLGYTLVSGPQHGTITFNADGSYVYTPGKDYNGSDSFTFKANDGSLDSNVGTVNLNVTPVNDAPVAANGQATIAEDTQLHGQVTATDVDGDQLGYTLVSGPQHGTIAFNADGSYVYTPGKDYNGADSFTFKANDGSLNSNTATVNLTVTPVNDTPVATNSQVTTAEDTQLQGHVTATDVDGDRLGYSLVSGPQHGAVTFNSDGTYVYTPGKDYNGTDSFTYKANDGSIDSNVAAVNLTVTPVNDAPVAAGAQVTTAEDTTLQGHVTATDVDGDHLTYTLVTAPQHGTVSFNSDGTFIYTPAANYNGADTFTYKANDGSLNSNTATVNLTVTPVNDAPTISADSATAEAHFIQLTQSQNPLGSTKVGDYLLHPTEGKAISDTSMINGVDPSNISLTYQAPVTVSFVAEGAGYHNMVGVYQFDSSGNVVPGSVQFVWLDASATSDNTVGASLVKDFLGNTQQHDVSLGSLPAGTNLGFFMISNGANSSTNQTLLKAISGVDSKGDNYASDLAAINSKLGVTIDSNGNGHITVNGVSMSGDTYFSSNKTWNTDLNTNDIQHVISGVTSSNDGKLYVGFEDLNGGGDRDYNDVVFNVDIGDYNLSKTSTATVQPHVVIGDVDSAQLSSATIDTHGFVSGDSLHVAQSSLFDVSITQNGYDYHISITAKSGLADVAAFQSYLNSIYFTSSSNHEGDRTIDYTVSDDQHAVSGTAESTVTLHTSYEISSSTLAASQTALGAGNDYLHLDAALSHKLDMGVGDNTVKLEQNNATFDHSQSQYLQNVDHLVTTNSGTNAVKLTINDVLDMTDGGHHLTIVGDTADTVTLTGDGSNNHWAQTGSHDGFNVYTWSDPNHAAVVEISQMMHQTAG